MFKRYEEYCVETNAPMVIHWPKGIKAKGKVRHQYHHVVDVVPTILELCKIEMPKLVDGVEQTLLPSVSMCYSFDDADAPTRKAIHCHECTGTRGLWSKGLEGRRDARLPSGTGQVRSGRALLRSAISLLDRD